MKCALIAAISGADTGMHRSSIDLFWRLNCCQSAIFRLQWTRRQTLTFSPYVGEYTVPLPANFNYPRVIRGLPTSAHSDVLRGHLYLYRCPCWLRNQPATWPWRRGGHLCQVAGGDYIITLRNTASFAQLPVYPICWTSVNKISCWTRLLTSFNCKYGVEWMVDL